MISNESSITMEFRSNDFAKQPYHSCTLIRPVFDRWLAEKATAAGAVIIPAYKVESVVSEGDKVAGIKTEGEDIGANVVVAADGALSFIAEQAGLRSRHDPHHYAVGVKETIELPRKTIEDRFNLHGDEGCAQLYFGSLTKGLTGGGFLYTNRASISLGVVVGIGALMDSTERVESVQLMESFKQLPEISSIIEGGETVEYSAHAIPEGGVEAVPKLYSNGILVVGDAAGFALNMGITVRGMDLAIASGALAAEAIKLAKKNADYSAKSLARYEELLNQSFVMRHLRTFKNVWNVLDNPRLFTKYPEAICSIMKDLMSIGSEPKTKLSSTVIKHFRKSFLSPSALRDAFSLTKV
jgi:electron transfer flavoprotein-quinone oxidoreductase